VSIKVIIAGETLLDCQLLSRALKPYSRHFAVVGCGHTSSLFTPLASGHQPDVAVISAAFDGSSMGGFDLLRTLRASGAPIRSILLLADHDAQQVVEAFSAGAKGVVTKTDPLEVLCKCIQCVHAGQLWASSQELEWVMQALAEREPTRVVNAIGMPLLTARQEQIVRMVAEGMPNTEISTKLHLSEHTVKNHLFRIYEKLGVSNRVELVLYATSSRANLLGSDLNAPAA